ncbi:MAG: efflux RND transporter periplasmic adaptor subunit [Myxococcales bacterium]|nr:efflux RND transporter periplasmic adaptor subunit [Myxococcales bacterium]
MNGFVRRGLVVGMAVLLGCGAKDTKKVSQAPAEVSCKATDAERARVTLTQEAATRVGLATSEVRPHTAPRLRTLGGEVVPSTGRAIVVAAPLSGRVDAKSLVAGRRVTRGETLAMLVPTAPVDRDVRAAAERTVATAEARLVAMEARLERADKLVREGAAAARTAEEARVDRDTARAEVAAAKARAQILHDSPLDSDVAIPLRAPEDGVIRAVNVPPAGLVPAGATVLELVGTSALWVRVSLFSADLRRVSETAEARVRPLGAEPSGTDVPASRLYGPLTADAATGSVDLYYALPATTSFRPGERVAIALVTGSPVAAMAVPTSALVTDFGGERWVYVEVGPRVYERRRVEVDRVEGDVAVLARGPAIGTKVATTGSSELFGAETGTGK